MNGEQKHKNVGIATLSWAIGISHMLHSRRDYPYCAAQLTTQHSHCSQQPQVVSTTSNATGRVPHVPPALLLGPPGYFRCQFIPIAMLTSKGTPQMLLLETRSYIPMGLNKVRLESPLTLKAWVVGSERIFHLSRFWTAQEKGRCKCATTYWQGDISHTCN